MVNTRSHNPTNNHNNGGDNNATNTRPPLTLKQVLAMKAQMLQTMHQTMINMRQTIFIVLQGDQ
jgi:hypothetical protein